MPRYIAALIRHGDYHQLARTPSAHQPFALNSAGREHARTGARALHKIIRKNEWTLMNTIDCSRMQRAWQSARIIADYLQSKVGEEFTLGEYDALAERGVGSAANLSTRQIEEILHRDCRYTDPPANWKADSFYRLPLQGAESLLDAGIRVAAHLNEQMASIPEHVEKDVVKLFVGHGAAFRHAAFHLGVLEFEQLSKLSMHHGGALFLEFNPQSEWRHIAGEWKQRTPKSEFID